MSRRAAQLATFAVGVAVADGARVRQHAQDAKVIAGVPVLNYDLAYGGDIAAAADGAQESWIVALKEGATDEMIEELCKGIDGGCQMQGHPSSGGLPLFSMTSTEEGLEAVLKRSHGQAEFVEPDQTFHVPDDEVDETDGNDNGIQLASWGLRRIGVDRTSNKGRGSNIYVFDTGIRHSHRDFGGRAIPTLDMSSGRAQECNGNTNCARDADGHGTHCAGSAGGATFGVAPQARIYSVKVLSDQGTGSWSWSYEGLDWVGMKGRRPAVISMSLGGSGTGSSMRRAVDAAVSAGVTVVVAAGNENDNACGYSPAFVPSAISVGSTTSNDARSGFSNFGSCVEIWAPGSRIVSASVSSDRGSTSLSGTSMACPHVSGAVALRLSSNPGSRPSQNSNWLQNQAQKGRISGLKSSDTNNFLRVASA